MTRYRLITPLGVYAPGTILDTDLPEGQMFSLQWQAARRLAELGVVEPTLEPQTPRDEPGWTAEAITVQPQVATGPAHKRPATLTAKGRPKEHSKR